MSPPKAAIDGCDGQLRRAQRPMEALAGERVEEAGRVADEQPVGAGPARDPDADRGGTLDRVADLRARPRHGVVVRRRDRRGGQPARRRSRPRSRSRDPPAPIGEDDPDVDPAARDRREPDIAAVEHDHPGVANGVGPRIGDVERQRRPIAEGRTPRDAGIPGDDRAEPVGADDHGGVGAFRRWRAWPRRRATDRTVDPGRISAPASAAIASRCGSSRDRSSPTAAGRERPIVAVRQAELRPDGGLDPHRRDPAGDRRQVRVAHAQPSQPRRRSRAR